MIKLFERLIELLGLAQDDPAVTALTNELGETPRVCAPIFLFPKNGFHIISFGGSFRVLTLTLRDSSERPGISAPYAGDLPGEILVDDGRNEVRKKLHSDPFRVDLVEKAESDVKYSTEYFHYAGCVLQIEFELPRDVICSVMVRKDEEDISEEEMDTPFHTMVPRSRPRRRSQRHR